MAATPAEPREETSRLRTALSVYADWRMAQILLLGFVSGFPWVLEESPVSPTPLD